MLLDYLSIKRGGKRNIMIASSERPSIDANAKMRTNERGVEICQGDWPTRSSNDLEYASGEYNKQIN